MAAAPTTPAAPPSDCLKAVAEVHFRAQRQRATRLESLREDLRPAPAMSPSARPPPKPNQGVNQLTDTVFETTSAPGKPEEIPQGKVDTRYGATLAEVERLRNVAWAAIGSVTMDGPVKDRYFNAWTQHCRLYPNNDRGPHLPPSNIGDMLLTFAVAVREGKYGLGHQVKVQSVAVALQSVAQKYVLDGHPDPRRASPAQHALDLPIARILKRFDDEDPAPEPKLPRTIQPWLTW